MKDKLKKFNLVVYWNESDDPDRKAIDFNIADKVDNVAWVWGNNPFNDVQCECTHPSDHGCVEFGDDDERGECLLCGATCDWHWEDDSGDVEDYHWDGKSRCIDEWYTPKQIGGVIGEYIEQLKKEF